LTGGRYSEVVLLLKLLLGDLGWSLLTDDRYSEVVANTGFTVHGFIADVWLVAQFILHHIKKINNRSFLKFKLKQILRHNRFQMGLPSNITGTKLRSFADTMITAFPIPVTDWNWTWINLINNIFQIVILIMFPTTLTKHFSITITIIGNCILKKLFCKCHLLTNSLTFNFSFP
jgi:hypothetical protein